MNGVWPPDCPPNDSIEGAGWYYRITKNNPPANEDFLTHHETGKMKKLPPCERCALSTCQVVEDAIQTRRLFPMLGSFIARGNLDASCGRIKLTGGVVESHTNWWPHEHVESRRTRFAVQEIDDVPI